MLCCHGPRGPSLSSRPLQVLKVAILAEKYAVDYTWYVDTILNLIRIAGDYVSEEVWYRVIQIVINRDDVQGYAAKTVFEVPDLARGGAPAGPGRGGPGRLTSFHLLLTVLGYPAPVLLTLCCTLRPPPWKGILSCWPGGDATGRVVCFLAVRSGLGLAESGHTNPSVHVTDHLSAVPGAGAWLPS